MKRIAVLGLLAAGLTAGWSMPMQAQDNGKGQSEKSVQKQQTELYKYQKKQEKAQAKAQRRADKQQQKAANKYEKQQRKLLKNSTLPPKRAR